MSYGIQVACCIPLLSIQFDAQFCAFVLKSLNKPKNMSAMLKQMQQNISIFFSLDLIIFLITFPPCTFIQLCFHMQLLKPAIFTLRLSIQLASLTTRQCNVNTQFSYNNTCVHAQFQVPPRVATVFRSDFTFVATNVLANPTDLFCLQYLAFIVYGSVSLLGVMTPATDYNTVVFLFAITFPVRQWRL